MKKIITPQTLLELIQSKKDPAQVIGPALVRIFEFQTKDEQQDNSTQIHNGIGFTGADGRSGSLTAKYYLKHRSLQQWQIDRWMKISEKTGLPRICKYHKQLNILANLKLQAK